MPFNHLRSLPQAMTVCTSAMAARSSHHQLRLLFYQISDCSTLASTNIIYHQSPALAMSAHCHSRISHSSVGCFFICWASQMGRVRQHGFPLPNQVTANQQSIPDHGSDQAGDTSLAGLLRRHFRHYPPGDRLAGVCSGGSHGEFSSGNGTSLPLAPHAHLILVELFKSGEKRSILQG